MIAGLITPSGNLAALTPQPVTVKPIASEAVAVGDVVRFDVEAGQTAYSSTANIINYDEPNCPFNVIKKTAASDIIGPFGVVVEGATAGNRCTVCVVGVCDAKFSAAITKGNCLTAGAGVFRVASGTSGVGNGVVVGVALETLAAAGTAKVLIQGFVFGNAGN